MAVRCVVTINTSKTDGETRRSECAAIADLLHRFEQVLVSSSGMVVSGAISDRNGTGSALTYVYTPTASA
jgi:hypothetical protein